MLILQDRVLSSLASLSQARRLKVRDAIHIIFFHSLTMQCFKTPLVSSSLFMITVMSDVSSIPNPNQDMTKMTWYVTLLLLAASDIMLEQFENY